MSAEILSFGPVSIVELDDCFFPQCRKYRITGGEIRSDWADRLRKCELPWCEFSIWFDGARLGSYGGACWPSAWPELFRCLPPSTHGSGVELTDAGMALVKAVSR